MKIEIYNREKINNSALRLLHESNICEENKKLILEFITYKTDEDGIGISRQSKYLIKLRIIAEHLNKPFVEVTKEDIKELLEVMYSMDVHRGEATVKMSDYSKSDYVVILKVFYKWLRKSDHPEETSWIKQPKVKHRRLSPDEILSWGDVVLLSKSSMCVRDKALPQVLWESGARIEELLTLLVKDVETVKQGEALIIHLRTSKTEVRNIALVKSAPALISWMENHPLRNNKDAPLWVKSTNTNDPMNYNTARKVFRDLKKRSKLDKPVNPHNFRKSSASYFSHSGLTEFEIKQRFGWVQASEMLNVYVHPDEQRINDKYLQMEGVIEKTHEEQAKEDANLKPKKCNWCNTINAVGDVYCRVCKRPLDEKQIALQTDIKEAIGEEIKKYFMNSPEIFNQIIANANGVS